MTWECMESRAVGGVVLVATLTAGIVITLGLDISRDSSLQAPYPLNGQTLTFPAIRDAWYSRNCRVYRAYESGDAFAFCQEDHHAYRWLPDQQQWIPITTTR